MGAVVRSTAVSLLLLLLLQQLISPGHGQYMTGYGTGPFVPEMMLPFPDSMDANNPKYDGAKSASQFAAVYYGSNSIGRSDQFPKQESPYKYHAPLYPSAATGTLLQSLSHPFSYGYGAVNSQYGNGVANSGYGYGAANSGYGYGADNSGYGYGAANSGYGYGAANSGYGYGADNSGYGYGAANGGYGYGAANGGYGYGAPSSPYGYGGLPFF